MEKLLEILKNFNRLIDQQHLVISAIITFVYVSVIIIEIVKFKKVPFFETILFILPILVIGFDYYARYVKGHSYFIKGNEALTLKIISIYVYLLALLVSLIIFIFRLVKAKHKTNSNISDDLCGVYLNKERKLSLNKNFSLQLVPLGINSKKWNKKCLGIYIDNEDIEYQKLGEYISTIDGNFVLRLRFPEDKELILSLQKQVNENGYILKIIESDVREVIKEQVLEENTFDKKVNNSTSIVKYLESLNEPIGYFDSSIDKYRLTKNMMDKLNLDTSVISSEEFKNFVYYEDYVTYDALLKQTSGSYKYRYRLKTSDGIEWYEEVKAYDPKSNELIATFHKVIFESENAVIFTRENLNKDLEARIDNNEEFGLVFLYIERAQSLIRKYGNEAGKVIIENYFNVLKKDLLTTEDNIYKISNSEYCILFSELDKYYEVQKGVLKGSSKLIKADVYFEGNKYVINNTIGFVYSEDVQEKNALECVEAGLLSLYLAQNDENKKYNIYSIENVRDGEDDFETYKVDLDNTFLKNL